MLSLKYSEDSKPKRVIPNILPCEISYTGSVDSSKRFWDPQVETIKQNGKPDTQVEVAYFRGRRLLGKTVELPPGYKGIIVSSEKQTVVQEAAKPRSLFSSLARRDVEDDDEDEDEDEDEEDFDTFDQSQQGEIPLETMSETAAFHSVTVWEHEAVPNSQEPFIRGVEEWLPFAQTVHGSD